MKRLILILVLLIPLVGFGQQKTNPKRAWSLEPNPGEDEYYRKVDWKFIPDSVVQLSDTTYVMKAIPFDYKDPGAADRIVGQYVDDFIGHRYEVIDSTSTSITVYDIHKTGQAPQSSQISRCYNAVGEGVAKYVGSSDYSPLDKSARWKLNGADNEILWRLLAQPWDTIQMTTIYDSIPKWAEGKMYYDTIKHAYTYYNDISDVSVNLGQELLFRVFNFTTDTIPNARVITPSITTVIDLADNRYSDKSLIVAVTTHAIPPGEWGWATKVGQVGSFNTSGFSEGEILYLGENGLLTNIPPVGGRFRTVIGVVDIVHETEGVITVDIVPSELAVEVIETNGYPPEQRDSSIMTVNNTTREFTIAPVGSMFHYYVRGLKYEIETPQTVSFSDTEGVVWFYFDDTGLKSINNPTQGEKIQIILEYAFTAMIFWNADDNEYTYDIFEERHGISMSPWTHVYLHLTRGSQYISGYAPGDIIADANGNLDAHAQFSVTAGAFADEDIFHEFGGYSVGETLEVAYMSGPNSNPRSSSTPGFAVLINGNGRIVYNEWTGATWQLTEVGSGNFVLYHIFGMNGDNMQLISVAGQNEYSTISDARAGATEEITNILIGFEAEEGTPIMTLIYETKQVFGNAVKGRIRTTDEGDDFIDWRTSELAQGTPPSSHANLLNLEAAGTGVTWGHINDIEQTIVGPKTFSDTVSVPLAIADNNAVPLIQLSDSIGVIRDSLANHLTRIESLEAEVSQTLSTDNTPGDISISGGNNITLNVNDADFDPSNEFQDLSNTPSGQNVTVEITYGGNTTFSIADLDNDPANELQDISGIATNAADIQENTDSIIANESRITTLESAPSEIQTISTNNSPGDISISGGNNITLNVSDADYVIGNEFQDLVWNVGSGDLSITDGTGVNLDGRYLQTESDPIFVAHTVYNISNGTGLLKNNGVGVWTYDNNTYLTSYTETDPIWNSDKTNYYTSAQVDALPVSTFTNDAGYITGYTETDPIYLASSWFGTVNNSPNWNTAFNWGNHALAGYLTSYTETDPVYLASSWYTTTNNSTNWNTAYGWGDHSLEGYLTSYSETDPVYSVSSWFGTTNNSTNWNTAYGWGNHALAGYLTSFSETDPIWTADKPDYYTSAQVDALPVSTFTNDAGYITSVDVPDFSGATFTDTIIQVSHGFSLDDWVGYLEPQSKFIKALANTPDSADVIGVVIDIIDASTFVYQFGGIYTGGSYTKGLNYFLSPTGAGSTTTTDTWNVGEVRLFLGTGVDNGFLVEIALGDEIEVSDYATEDTLSNYVLLSSYDYTRAPNGPSGDFNTQTGNSYVSALNGSTNTPFGSAWYSLVNIRHRGGGPDGGNLWGSQIAIGMTSHRNRIAFRAHNNGTWESWYELYHAGNFTDNSTNWNTAYGWGNHALAGYLTSFSESDPVFGVHTVSNIYNGIGLLKNNGSGTWSYDNSTYLTGNQSITLSGDVSGTGTTSIVTTVANNSHNHIASNTTDFDTEVSNNTSVTANTAKTSNANHTSEVTGSAALTIANNVIEAVNMETTNSPSDNDIYTYDAATGGGTWEAAASGGGGYAGCIAYSTATIVKGAFIPFANEYVDTDAYHSTVSNTDRFYAPTTGVYKITLGYSIQFTLSGTETWFQFRYHENGVETYRYRRDQDEAWAAGEWEAGTFTRFASLTAGDYISYYFFNNNTSGPNASEAHLEITFIQ